MTEAKFANGDILKDIVTGFEGAVMVVAFYSTGCVHCGLQSRKLKDDGTFNNWEWFDQSRLELVKKEALVFDVTETSGPMPTGPQL